MARMGDLLRLSSQTAGLLPPPCVDCVFWQHDRLVTDGRRKQSWSESFERRHGPFGRILRDGDRFRGMIQYGPSSAFPRALTLPAGPATRGAALVTCCFLEGDDPKGLCERLLLEALADVKSRGFRNVEAFALGYPDDVPTADRFVGHHTLFDRDFLASLGFNRVRAQGQVSLMRIELGGLQPDAGVLGRLAAALRPHPAPDASPA